MFGSLRILLNNIAIKEEIKVKIKKYLELKKRRNIQTIKNNKAASYYWSDTQNP